MLNFAFIEVICYDKHTKGVCAMNKTKELSKYEQISIGRIKSLIQTRCDGSQKKFADKTGLNVGSVSQYVNGRNVPSNLNAQKIAEAFDVEPEWVMGFEPKKRTRPLTIGRVVNPKPPQLVGITIQEKGKTKKITKTIAYLNKDETKILSLYRAGKYKEIVNLMMEKMP